MKRLYGAFCLFLFLILFTSNALSLTLNVNPNPATVGQTVTMNMSVQLQPVLTTVMLPPPVYCEILINYGDGSSGRAGICRTLNCNLTTNHSYANPGQYTVYAYINPNNCNRSSAGSTGDEKVLTVRCRALTFSSPSVLPDGEQGKQYNVTLSATGGQPPLSYSLLSGALPPGLTLSSNGIISGTPTSSGRYVFNALVRDSCPVGSQRDVKRFSIEITGPRCPAIAWQSPSMLPKGKEGVRYSYSLQVTGGQTPVTYSLSGGSLPPGLTLASSGLISGTPTTPGTFRFAVMASDSCPAGHQRVSKNFTIVIDRRACRSMAWRTVSLPDGKVGTYYNASLSIAGGEPPVTFSIVGGTLPSGLTLSPNGVISGVPASKGSYSFRVMAADSCYSGHQRLERDFNIEIKEVATQQPQKQCPELYITTTRLPKALQGQPYSCRITTTGGTPPVSFRLSAGRLPSGISLSSTGLLSGIPTQKGNYRFDITAYDSCESGTKTSTRSFQLIVEAVPKHLALTVYPHDISIPRGLPATLNLTYTFSGDKDINTRLSSSNGLFVAMGKQIGSVSMPLDVHIRNGNARVNEKVYVPVAVLKRAERLGSARFQYIRRFRNEHFDLSSSVNIAITTEAAAPFRISRIQLYFENNRAEITISKGQKPPKLYAEIRYLGTGLLKGYWEVDGRPLANVFRHITYGRSVTLKLPETAVLPTFEPGIHRVRFVITEPGFDAELPEAIYFITAKAYQVKKIRLVSPLDEEKLTISGLSFNWKELGLRPFAYLIEFREGPEDKPLFSAYVKTSRYTVPQQIAVRYFSSVKRLYWQVKGFDDEGRLIGKSDVRKIVLDNKNVYVPGQIILTWSKNGKASVSKLERSLGIKLIYKFELKTIGQICGVFSTNGQDVLQVMKKASRMSVIKHAGPNYIFQLLIDPLFHRQVLEEYLDISRLRSVSMGKDKIVAIVDTGVDSSHPDLRDAILDKKNFVNNSEYRSEIHGTAVSGIIGARVNNVGMEGVAPLAKLLVLRACIQIKSNHAEGQCFSDSISRALDYAVERGAHVVNMSLGAYQEDGVVSAIIQKGRERGIVFVAPAGNSVDAEMLPFPARLKEVVSVGGVLEDGSLFPNRTVCQKADVVVPCQNIFTTVPGGYNFLNGTSMASALVAGFIAIDAVPPTGLRRPVRPLSLCEWLNTSLKEKDICKGSNKKE